jgi:HlyD family secretion protein
MAKRIIPLVVALVLFGYFGWRTWEHHRAAAREDRFYGTADATEVVVSAQVAGRVIVKKADEGSKVEQGDTVMMIDPTPYQNQLNQAKAAQATAESQVAVIDANIAHLDTNLGRFERLYNQAAAPKANYDDLVEQRRVLAAQKEVIQKQIEQAKAAVELAATQLGFTNVMAPISGTVLRVNTELGELCMPGSALFTMADLDSMEVRIYVPETMLGKIKLGQKAQITTDSFPDQPIPAKVTYIAQDAEFTPKNVQTRDERVRLVFLVKVTADNRDGVLKIGMPVDARFLEQ